MDRVEDGPPVAIIGGGYAGCAAAVTLADAGVRCVLHEAAPVLGGRGRRVERDGFALDNGQHLLLGAYAATLALAAKVAPGRPAFLRRPLALVPFGRDQPGALSLVVRRAPGRLGLALGLLTAAGLTWRERLANVAWFRDLERSGFVRPRGETVARMLKPLPRNVAQRLWEPLCLAALNTPAKTASAQVFANVLRASFTGSGTDCDFVLATTDLSAFVPEAAARYVQDRGGVVETGRSMRIVRAARDGVMVAAGDTALAARAVIVATSPHRIETAFAPEALALQPALRAAVGAMKGQAYEPLATVWLGYASRIDLPAPVARLDDAPGQWLIDRPDILATAGTGAPALAQLVAVVISAGGAHMTQPHAALVREVDAQLRRLRPDLPPLAWSFVIVEKRATYACTPDRVLPAAPRFAPGIYLAGDYAYPEFPATLEAAVRSGIAAAQAVLDDRVRPSVSHP